MHLFNNLKLEFLCGILCAYAAPLATASLGQDGQVILGIFVPIVAIIIGIVIARLCWEWNSRPHRDPDARSNARHTAIENQEGRFVDPPVFPGRFMYEVNRHPSTLHRYCNAVFACHSTDDLHLSFNPNRNPYYIPTSNPQHSSTPMSPPRIEIESDFDKLCSTSGKKRSNHHMKDNDMPSCRLFEANDTLVSQGELTHSCDHLDRSSSIKSIERGVWLEGKKHVKKNERSRQRRMELRLKRIWERRAEMEATRVRSLPARNGTRSSLRNNMKPNRKINSAIDIVGKRNRFDSAFDVSNGHLKNVSNNSRQVINLNRHGRGMDQPRPRMPSHRVARRSSSVISGPRVLKSCLKAANPARRPSKHVRFQLNGTRKRIRKHNITGKNKRVIILIKKKKNLTKLERKPAIRRGRFAIEVHGRGTPKPLFHTINSHNNPQPVMGTISNNLRTASNQHSKHGDNNNAGGPPLTRSVQQHSRENGLTNLELPSPTTQSRPSEIQLSPEIDPVFSYLTNSDVRPVAKCHSSIPGVPDCGMDKNCNKNRDKTHDVESQPISKSVFFTEESCFALPRENRDGFDLFGIYRES